MVSKDNGKKAYCVQAAYFSKYLGYLDVEFDDSGEVVRAAGNPILLDNSVPKGWCYGSRLGCVPFLKQLLFPLRSGD